MVEHEQESVKLFPNSSNAIRNDKVPADENQSMCTANLDTANNKKK